MKQLFQRANIPLIACLLAAAAIIALSHTAAATTSSDQVLSTITGSGNNGGYLDPGEAAQLLVDGPVDLNGVQYWLVYTYQSSQSGTQNVVLSVSDDTGLVTKDNATLQPLLKFALENNIMASMNANKESLDDFDLFLSDATNKQQTASNNYYKLVKQQISQQYTSLDFNYLETSLNAIQTNLANAQQQVNNDRSFLSQYNSYPNVGDYDNYYTQFNQTLTALDTLVASAQTYQTALVAQESAVTNSASLNYSDKSVITSALEQLSNVGAYSSFSSTVLTPSERDYESFSLRLPNQVQLMTQSSLSRIARKDATNAFTSSFQATVQNALTPATLVQYGKCSVDVTDLKSQWAIASRIMSNPSNASFSTLESVPNLVSTINADLANAQTGLASCASTNNSATTTAPAPSAGWVTDLLILVLVALIGYTLYKRWKDSQEQNV